MEEGEEEQKDEPVENEASELINRAEESAKAMKEQNEKMAKNIAELQKLKIETTLGGKAETRVKQEESDEDYAEKALRGDLNG